MDGVRKESDLSKYLKIVQDIVKKYKNRRV